MASNKRQREEDDRDQLYKKIQKVVKELEKICPDNNKEQATHRLKIDLCAENNKRDREISEIRNRDIKPLEEKIYAYKRMYHDTLPKYLCGVEGELHIFNSDGVKVKIESVPYSIVDKFFKIQTIVPGFKAGRDPVNDIFWEKIREHYKKQSYDVNIEPAIERIRASLDRVEEEIKKLSEELCVAQDAFYSTEKDIRNKSVARRKEIEDAFVPDPPNVIELKEERDRLLEKWNAQYRDFCSTCDTLFTLDITGNCHTLTCRCYPYM